MWGILSVVCSAFRDTHLRSHAVWRALEKQIAFWSSKKNKKKKQTPWSFMGSSGSCLAVCLTGSFGQRWTHKGNNVTVPIYVYTESAKIVYVQIRKRKKLVWIFQIFYIYQCDPSTMILHFFPKFRRWELSSWFCAAVLCLKWRAEQCGHFVRSQDNYRVTCGRRCFMWWSLAPGKVNRALAPHWFQS